MQQSDSGDENNTYSVGRLAFFFFISTSQQMWEARGTILGRGQDRNETHAMTTRMSVSVCESVGFNRAKISRLFNFLGTISFEKS